MNRQLSSNSVGSALRKVESYQYPATHVGHLSDAQNEALEAFKQLSADKGYFRPATREQPASHDDETMLRYLRARKFTPQDAFKQFKDTEDWRRNEKIDELYETIDVDEYDETRRLYPQWTGRRDKRGIPVYVFEVAHLTSKRMSAYEKSISKAPSNGKTSPKLIRLFALYENLLRFALPLCSGIPDRPYGETPVSQSNNIVDISGVGLKQFWNLRQHMQDASQLATAHYPETLDRIFIIGAPSFFPTVWSWIKNWFDPITVSKIFILSKDSMKSTLETYIDPANVPRKYGGTLDWQWGSLPSLEPVIEKALKWDNPTKTESGQNGFPTGPVRWVESESGDLVAHAVGSVNGKQRDITVAHLPVHASLAVGSLSAQLSRLSTAQNLAVPSESNDPMFGHPSTSGTHTHPTEDQEYFPTSGATPPSEHDEDPVGTGAESDSTLGVAQQVQSGADAPPQGVGRQGTSSTRFAEQAGTHAEGQLKENTPEVVDHGYGDKTSTMEPATVGQARKDVEVPEAVPPEEPQQQPGYLEQAKNAAAGAAAAAGGLGTAVMAKVGLGGTSGAEAGTGEKEADAAGEEKKQKVDDPRVDRMEDKDVEEFIRGQYTTGKK